MFAVGDKVNWHWSTTSGYGYSRLVPAIVIGTSEKRVRIATMRKRSWWDNGRREEWIREEKSVRPDKLSVRTESCQIVDQE